MSVILSQNYFLQVELLTKNTFVVSLKSNILITILQFEINFNIFSRQLNGMLLIILFFGCATACFLSL